MGMRSTEHTIVDVSDVTAVRPGDRAVLIGAQDGGVIDPFEFAETNGLPLLEIFSRLCSGASRAYVRSSASD